jgi:hypothetical protein
MLTFPKAGEDVSESDVNVHNAVRFDAVESSQMSSAISCTLYGSRYYVIEYRRDAIDESCMS